MADDTDWARIIDERLPPEDLVAGLVDVALHATTYTAKGDGVIPDRKTRLAAYQTLLLHRRGQPQRATDIKPTKGDGRMDLLELLSDPEYAAKVERAIAKARAKSGG